MAEVKLLRASEVVVQHQEWGALHWYAGGAVGNSQDMTVGKCVLKPGCENPLHQHPNCEEILHVAAGRIVHSVEGKPDVEMGEGDTIVIPPEVLHNARNVGSEDAVLLIAFSSADRQTKGE